MALTTGAKAPWTRTQEKKNPEHKRTGMYRTGTLPRHSSTSKPSKPRSASLMTGSHFTVRQTRCCIFLLLYHCRFQAWVRVIKKELFDCWGCRNRKCGVGDRKLFDMQDRSHGSESNSVVMCCLNWWATWRPVSVAAISSISRHWIHRKQWPCVVLLELFSLKTTSELLLLTLLKILTDLSALLLWIKNVEMSLLRACIMKQPQETHHISVVCEKNKSRLLLVPLVCGNNKVNKVKLN